MFAGYLPTFWLKVRLLAAPVIQSHLATHWPVALGGVAQITVGMIATFVSISCVVASDVGAFTIGARPRPPPSNTVHLTAATRLAFASYPGVPEMP